jgi:hypothetical protein
MEYIVSLYNELKHDYDHNQPPLSKIVKLGICCIDKLNKEAKKKDQGQIHSKKYSVFLLNKEYSRPFQPDIYISNTSVFNKLWQQIFSSIDTKSRSINIKSILIDRALYTSIISFACCYDLWKRSSRKTPGTYFEVVLGSLIKLIIPKYNRTKHIPITSAIQNGTAALIKVLRKR